MSGQITELREGLLQIAKVQAKAIKSKSKKDKKVTYSKHKKVKVSKSENISDSDNSSDSSKESNDSYESNRQ